MEPTNGQCGVQPSIVFLLVTLLVTSAATAMLCASIMTDHWEYITWDRGKLEDIAKRMQNTSNWNHHYQIEWLLDGQVARVPLEAVAAHENNSSALFLVPVHGGLWTVCITIEEDKQVLLSKLGFPQTQCTNYLTPELMKEEARTDWQHRMQNLSISCALVCLIILGSSALVGAFGVMKHQISAVLVTGVMYLLAATFAMFTLAIIHFKRSQSEYECVVGLSKFGRMADGIVTSTKTHERPYTLGKAKEYFRGRILATGWSVQMGWGGVGMCVLVSVLWILLSKIMRYNPLTTLLTVL